MPNIRTLDRSFAGGELSPEMFGRVDLAKFQTGLGRAYNFMVRPHGPAVNRPGFEFVRATKNGAQRSRLIPFSFNTEQTFAIEFGPQYVRFHTMGATLESATDVPYEVTTPYAEADLFDVHYVQSADVLTLVHPKYPPKELRRVGALDWQLVDVTFAPTTQPPTGLTATASGPGGGNPRAYSYVVTASTIDGAVIDESVASAAASASADLSVAGNKIMLNWTALTPTPTRYDVYKAENGVYGFIGHASGTTFTDDNIAPDMTLSPPSGNNPFSSPNNYPSTTSYYEQRRAFASTFNRPQTVWLTRSGTESNMSQSIPTRDDDAVVFRIAAREMNAIRHLVPLNALIALTASGEWRIQSTDTGALSPTSLSAKPQTYTGASNVQPVTVGSNILYARARGGRVAEFSYASDPQGGYKYQSADLSLAAPHLFQGFQIVDMAMAKAPYQVLWCVSSNGELVACTYVPEQQVAGWHHHATTNGAFESVCVIGEGAEDVLYAIVRRTINGQQVRYVERMHTREFDELADAYFVDAGVSYSGAPISTITSGLSHLEGQTVSILADGGVIPQQVVTNGTITLPKAASKIQIGLPILAQLQTLPLSFETMALGQGRAKNVNKVYLRLYKSSGAWVGPSFDPSLMTELKIRTDESWGTPPRLQTGEFEHVLESDWNQDGTVCVEQRDPLPFTLSAMSMEVAIGS